MLAVDISSDSAPENLEEISEADDIKIDDQDI